MSTIAPAAPDAYIRNRDTGKPGHPTKFAEHPHNEPEVALTAEPRKSLDGWFETLDEKLETMYAEVRDRVEELRTDEGWNKYLETMQSFRNYSFSNQMLIAIQKPDATRVASKRHWKNLGRTVKEDGKMLAILAPKMAWVNKRDDDGNDVLDAEGKKIRVRRVIGFTSVTVYDVSDTEGDPLPTFEYTELSETPPDGLEDDLMAAVHKFGFTVTTEKMDGHKKGYTTPKGVVALREGLSEPERVATLAHELAHIAAGHLDRLGDYHISEGGKRGAMEVEADSIAHVILRVNGMKSTATSTGEYVAGWATTDENSYEVVKEAGERVSSTVRELLKNNEWRNVLGEDE